MITIREALGNDASAIADIFHACYGEDYPHSQFYDVSQLLRMIYSSDTLLLVAEDTDTGNLIGTASVLLEVGAFSDLLGEFGRLAVHPAERNRGAGKLLMRERLQRVEHRLHVGMIDARLAHPYTLKIAESQGFSIVGFLPMKMKIAHRESLIQMVRYFGDSMELRCNHPRLIPEVFPLAHLAMSNCGVPFDGIVDEASAAYPAAQHFVKEELTTQGYSALLRIERGRVRHREVFGPVRLHYGFFKIQSTASNYLLAREEERIVGAIGFLHDPSDNLVRVFELISLDDYVIRFLLESLHDWCKEREDVCYIEIDVSAYAPRMQRTLLELGFLPTAYIPAMVFHEVERLDVIKMGRLLCPLNLGELHLSPKALEVADVVMNGFQTRSVLPRLEQAVQEVSLFAGLSEEQRARLAALCSLESQAPTRPIFRQGEVSSRLYLILSGEVIVTRGDSPQVLDAIQAGECLGELSLLTHSAHSATATAKNDVEMAILTYEDMQELVRMRPDIAVIIYQNLATGLGAKLKRSAGPA